MKNNKLLESKILTVVALLMVIAATVIIFILKMPIWTILPCFFAFMMVFSHLASLLIKKLNPAASRTMDKCALACSILTLLAFIGVFVCL